jgi:hypothetical protein
MKNEYAGYTSEELKCFAAARCEDLEAAITKEGIEDLPPGIREIVRKMVMIGDRLNGGRVSLLRGKETKPSPRRRGVGKPIKNMTDTPKTDSQARKHLLSGEEIISAELGRELERENARLRAALEYAARWTADPDIKGRIMSVLPNVEDEP